MASCRSFKSRVWTLTGFILAFAVSAGFAQDRADPGAQCSARQLELSVPADDTYTLRLDPGHAYIGWLQEDGMDVAVSTDDGQSWVDSAPWRWADEPLLLVAEADGNAQLSIRGMRKGRTHHFGLRLQCASQVTGHARLLWADARQLSALRARLDESWNLREGMFALSLGIRALFFWADTEAERAWIQFQLAALARQRGMLREASEWYRLAAESSERAHKPKWYSSALYRRGQALYAGGSADVGDLFLKAAQVSRAESQAYQAVSAMQDYCLILRANGDVAAAIECLQEQVSEIHRLDEPADESVVLRNLATAYLFQGRYLEAREALAQAAEIAESLNDAREIAGALVLQSHLDTWAGNFDLALQRLRRARALRVDTAEPLEAARVDSRIANVLLQAGRTILARSYLEQASQAFELYGARGWLGESYIALSHSYGLDRDPETALRYAQRAAEVLADTGTITQRADALIELAKRQLAVGQDSAAGVTLDAIRKLQTEPPWSDVVDAAIIERTLKQRAGGVPLDREMLVLIDGALSRGQIVQYLDLVSLMVKGQGTDVSETEIRDRAERAMSIGQQLARKVGSPTLRNSLLRRLQPVAFREIFQLRNGQELSADAVRDLIEPAETLRAIDRQARRKLADNDALNELERVLADELLSRQVSGVSAERRELLLRAMQGGDEQASTAEVHELDLAEVAKPDTAFYYFVSENDRNGYLLWNGNSWSWHLIGDPSRFRQVVEELSDLLQKGQSSGTRIHALARDLAAYTGLAGWPDGAPRVVYLLADPEAMAIPWSLLPLGIDGRPLGEVASIVLLQSENAKEPAQIDSVWLLGANPPNGSPLDSLPAVSRELEVIRGQWPTKPMQRSLSADLGDLLDALAEPGALVHVASHGLGDSGRPEESGLWLREPGNDAPVFVSALRLREIDAKASLIVLSACESGKSSAGLSLGAGGVAGSLVDTGVTAVVGNRWNVSDRTASQFAIAFHAALASPGSTIPGAMKRAIAALRSEPATAHPRHWAGWFVLQAGPELDGARTDQAR